MKDNKNRDKILNAATILFQEKGYYGTGLNEILRKSDCPKGSLYYYFPNGKEQLALESIELTKDYVSDLIKNKLDEIDDPGESISKFVREMADNLHKDSNDLSSFHSNKKISVNLMALETSYTNENIRQACKKAYEAWENVYYEKLLSNGYDEKEARRLSNIIEEMIEGAILMSVVKKDDKYLIYISEVIYSILSK